MSMREKSDNLHQKYKYGQMKNIKSSVWDIPKVCVAQESLSDKNKKVLLPKENGDVQDASSAGF